MAQDVIPGLEGIPIAESSISFVEGQASRLEYRGISIEELAEHSTFEETSYMLLFGKLPTTAEFSEFKDELCHHRRLKYRIIDLIKCLPEGGHPMDALQAGIAAIGMFYPLRKGMDDSDRRLACVRLISKMPTLVAAFERLRRGDEHNMPRDELTLAGNFLYMLTGEEPDPAQERILDICLILHADHTMNASTFSGRVVGSTLATPYSVASSALGALSGPLHGGANEDVMAMLGTIGSAAKARPFIQEKIANKQKVPGFGHRVYKSMDPRAKILKRYAEQLSKKSGTPHFEIAVEVEKVMQEHYQEKGIWPNVDFYSGIVYTELGIARDCFTPIFAMARVAGWMAHWLEQLTYNRIYRPTQKYVGKHQQKYVPIEKR